MLEKKVAREFVGDRRANRLQRLLLARPAANALRQGRVVVDLLAGFAIDALHGPGCQRVLGDGQARSLETRRELLDLGFAQDLKVGALLRSGFSFGPGAKTERLDAFLENIFCHRRRLRRRVRLIGIAHEDLHRHLRVAVGADKLDALFAGHLVERFLKRLDVHHGLGRDRHQAILAHARLAFPDDGRNVTAAPRQKLVLEHVVVLGERLGVEQESQRFFDQLALGIGPQVTLQQRLVALVPRVVRINQSHGGDQHGPGIGLGCCRCCRGRCRSRCGRRRRSRSGRRRYDGLRRRIRSGPCAFASLTLVGKPRTRTEHNNGKADDDGDHRRLRLCLRHWLDHNGGRRRNCGSRVMLDERLVDGRDRRGWSRRDQRRVGVGDGHTWNCGTNGVGEFAGCLKAVLGTLGERLAHDRVHLERRLHIETRRRQRILLEHLLHGGSRRAGEGALAGQELVEDHAGREKVRAAVHRQPQDLFRRHVGGGAHHGPDLGQIGRFDVGNAKVADLHGAVGQHENVRRLDVPMDDALAVRIIERIEDLRHDLHDACRREPLIRLEALLELTALDELHGNEPDPRLFAKIVDGNDVGMT